jgi:thiol-disulfide isomerase/thioredoxin
MRKTLEKLLLAGTIVLANTAPSLAKGPTCYCEDCRKVKYQSEESIISNKPGIERAIHDRSRTTCVLDYIEALRDRNKFYSRDEGLKSSNENKYKNYIEKQFNALDEERGEQILLINIFQSPGVVFHYDLSEEERIRFKEYCSYCSDIAPENIQIANEYYRERLGYDINFKNLDFSDKLMVFIYETRFKNKWDNLRN